MIEFTNLDPRSDAASALEQLHHWLKHAVEAGASDLHLVVGHPPVLRLHGDLIELLEPSLDGEQTESLLRALCPAEDFAKLKTQKNVDFSFPLVVRGRVNRFRANLFH